jgi:lysophospholipase L1-like esterase
VPSVVLTNPRAETVTVASLPELNHWLRLGYRPSGTVAAAQTAFTGQPTEPAAQEQYDSPALRAAFGRRGNRSIGMGDSIMAGSDSMTSYAVGGSWFSRLCESSGQRLRFVRNSGISGNRSDQMLARLQTDVIAYNPDVCVLEAITPNDPGTLTVAQSRTNVQAMVDQLRAAGIRVVVCTGPPNDTASTNNHMRQVSAWAVSYANSLGLPVFDLYAPLVDPADGTYLAAYTADGTHPTADGQEAVAAYLKTRLPGDLHAVPVLSPGKGDVTNLAPNGVFLGDTNADGIADSWTAAGGATGTLVATADGKGNWQQVVGTSGSSYLTSTMAAGWSVGDVLAVSGRWEQDGTQSVSLQTNCNGGTPYSQPRALSSRTTVVTDRTFHHEFPIPSGTTAITVRLIPGIGTARFAQLTVRNRTALGLLD